MTDSSTLVEPRPRIAMIDRKVRTAPPSTDSRRLNRTVLNYWLDAALLASVIFTGWVTAVIRIVFPAPTSALGWTLWGLSLNQWCDVQFFALGVCALLAVEHLVLHWNWICTVTALQVLRLSKRPDEGTQAVYGVAVFIGTLLAVLFGVIAALVCVRAP
jgi:hypothetical protein